jgi:Zn finger protein HypA/HybF involved in hydrogenase expression
VEKAAEYLRLLAADQPRDDENHILVLRCQDCQGVSAWVEWVEFNSRCPDCGRTRAEVWRPPEPPPLPELTDDEKARSLYGVPFPEAFGKERVEILLTCRQCNAASTYEMWEYAGRHCPECGSHGGAIKQ